MAISEVKSLGIEDFKIAFRAELSPYVAERINQYSFKFSEFTLAQKESLIIKIVNTLLDPQLIKSGEHRLDQWESGWGENLELLRNNSQEMEHIIPKYFNKYGAIRWCGDFIQPVSEKFEYNTLAIILDWVFDKYMRDVNCIYEFGCGTGHNLLGVRRVNSNARLWGLDWAPSSQKIINKIAESELDKNIKSYRFDYFNPDYSFPIESNAAVYTVASLEQVGENWGKFVDYLLEKKPKICIHIEPIGELLDESKLIDFLSIKYFKKRNYLNGFLDGLRSLERLNKIKIHKAQRTNIGSLFIEGYSVVVWTPL